MVVNDVFSLGTDIAINGFSDSILTFLTQSSSEIVSDESGFNAYVNFLFSAVPYIIIFFLVVLTAIVILKIKINKREKKLMEQPQLNRFDLDDFEKEIQEDDGN